MYNPVVEDTKLITPAYRQALANRGYDTYQKLRVLAQDILDKLNGMIDEYNDNHQSEQVYVLDINKAFNDLAATDTVEVDGQKVINLSQESIARRLILPTTRTRPISDTQSLRRKRKRCLTSGAWAQRTLLTSTRR